MNRSHRIDFGTKDRTVLHSKYNVVRSFTKVGVICLMEFKCMFDWSLNEKEIKKNLEYFKVPNTIIETITSNLVKKIFDEYANVLKGIYSIRFN